MAKVRNQSMNPAFVNLKYKYKAIPEIDGGLFIYDIHPIEWVDNRFDFIIDDISRNWRFSYILYDPHEKFGQLKSGNIAVHIPTKYIKKDDKRIYRERKRN